MREVARQSEGQYRLGPGTLYDNLQKLMHQGLVEEAARPSADEDPRRRYYRLTEAGRSVLEADIARLKRVVREASLAGESKSGGDLMARALYAWLLRLHPPGFRRQFAAEMLGVFDDAIADTGQLPLLLDGLASLARQWILVCPDGGGRWRWHCSAPAWRPREGCSGRWPDARPATLFLHSFRAGSADGVHHRLRRRGGGDGRGHTLVEPPVSAKPRGPGEDRQMKRVALVFLLVLLAGAIYEQAGERRDRSRYPRIGRAVDIGGHA